MVIRTSLFGALLALFLVGPAYGALAGDEQLPNLDQAAPRDVTVAAQLIDRRRRYRLGFDAATENVGAGPLTIHGRRRGGSRSMQVDQIVSRAGGGSTQLRSVGVMRYVVHPDHRHWHYVGFARYELRHANGALGGRSRSDRKTGFCLGDRYEVRGAGRLPSFTGFPQHADQCGQGQPRLNALFAGISVGYGDRYGAYLEGQYIDVHGLPAGRYTLVHTANPDRTLIESDYSDNSASALLQLGWPRGRRAKPTVRVLKRCPDTAVCR